MRKKIISAIFAILLIFTINNYSKAATASIQCSSTVEVNTPITISVTGSAVQWNLTLKVNGQSIASNSELDNVEGNKTISFSGKYTPTTEGNLTVTLEGSVTEASNGSTIKNFNSRTITVTKATNNTSNANSGSNSGNSNANNPNTTPTKSSVATLSNLGIKPNDFSGFKSTTYSYNVEVPNETESIEVYASKGQSGQTISGTGTKSLKEGANTFNIVVTAEDGKTQKTYTINVTRKAKEDQIEENSEEPMEEAFGLTELKIEGLELEPQFQTDVYEYRVELKEDLEKLNITTLATKANSSIEITGNENLQEGENIITIIVKGENEDETSTYQIIVNKILEKQEDTLNQQQQEKMKKIIILSVAGGIILVIVIAIIIIKIKKSKELNQGYIPYENLMDNYDGDNKVEEQTIKDNEEEFCEEEPKKKKRSKGKRFK